MLKTDESGKSVKSVYLLKSTGNHTIPSGWLRDRLDYVVEAKKGIRDQRRPLQGNRRSSTFLVPIVLRFTHIVPIIGLIDPDFFIDEILLIMPALIAILGGPH